MQIRKKIQWIGFGSLILLGLTISGAAFLVLSRHFEQQEDQKIHEAMSVAQHEMDRQLANLTQGATYLANKPEVISSILRGDGSGLQTEGRAVVSRLGIPTIVFTDAKGQVLARGHSPSVGDSLAQHGAVAVALSGRVARGLEQGQLVKFSFSSAAPVLLNGRVVGTVLTGMESLESNQFLDSLHQLLGVEFTLFLDRTRLSSTLQNADGSRLTGTSLDNPAILEQVLQKGQVYLGRNQIGGHAYTTAYWPLVNPQGRTVGMAFAGQSRDHILATYQSIFGAILGSVALFLIFIWFLFRRVIGKITRPLEEVASALGEVAKGNLTVQVTRLSDDETGAMGLALNATVSHLGQNIGDIAAISERTAASSTQLAATSQQVAAATHSISQGAATQREALALAAEDLHLLAQAIAKIRAESAESATTAERILTVTTSCREEMDASMRSMNRILESSTKVGTISNVISDIARQTNLLSLNAAIEAAKAGQHGRGFAVVADEIRKLAERSGTAAREITNLIEESRERAHTGSRSVTAVNEILGQIEVGAEACATLAREASVTLQEQSRVSGEAAQSMASTRQVAEDNAVAAAQLREATQDTHQTVQELSSLATQMAALTTQFQLV